jgi:hypothetical protein
LAHDGPEGAGGPRRPRSRRRGDVEPRSASSGEPAASTDERSRISSTVFVLNGIIVALAAVVAIVVLVVVLWR